ncbi:hypothetical protein [Nocardia donostiensis]|uniref:DUF2269 domain-containing protein n=1 Tax=Nocardia donostiensis TaxID=1538463 RepID=A0A1W0BIC9_9NOCA|nr:hypothetical protein [Nocardia donostiensis]ONM49829.1 hypothetical protein B0T46_05360 [Nocardia donostiensis]OQS12692.1 hypothetical protein B0T36_23690 [Nocardia donostiensis]OQS22219.1 hypothetical protein B0T44_06175 [Nocardia donostiensis]
MTKFFLSVHVLVAIIAIGPVTVAASMFPAILRRALGEPGDSDARTNLRTLHRICRVYAGIGIAVPVFGFATAGSLGVLGDAWLIISILLTATAAGVLALLILPAQDRALAETEGSASPLPVPTALTPGRLAMLTGIFNLLWATVTVLMIVRPGSTAGV